MVSNNFIVYITNGGHQYKIHAQCRPEGGSKNLSQINKVFFSVEQKQCMSKE